MRLFDVTGSPNCRKVRGLARELGLALELVPVDLAQARDSWSSCRAMLAAWRDRLRQRPAWQD